MFYWISALLTLFLLLGYSLLLIGLRIGLNRFERDAHSRFPTVTLIVPAHNEENTLPNLLNRISQQNYPENSLEIVLVDDCSEDRTHSIMKEYEATHPGVKVLKMTDRLPGISSKKRAITEAIRISGHEIIVTTDADASPGPDWIASLVSRYDASTDMVLGYAPYRTDGSYRSLFHRLLALDYFAMGSITAASTALGLPATCNGANFSYRRSVFLSIGGFGDSIKWMSGDDDLLLHRMRKKGKGAIRFTPSKKAAVFNNPPATFRDFIRQRIRFASKHLAYPQDVKSILIGIYLLHGMLLGFGIGSFFSILALPVFLASMSVKAVFELLFLIRAQRILENRNLVVYYPIAVLPYLFYVVLFPLLGHIMPRRW